jgi:hypothetical protein
VHDDVDEVDEHPLSARQAFDRDRAVARLAELLFDGLGDRGDVPIVLARHEHEKVRVVDLAGDIEDLDLGRFFVERRFGSRHGDALGFVRRSCATFENTRARARTSRSPR